MKKAIEKLNSEIDKAWAVNNEQRQRLNLADSHGAALLGNDFQRVQLESLRAISECFKALDARIEKIEQWLEKLNKS